MIMIKKKKTMIKMKKVLTRFQLKISNQKKLKIFLIFIIIYCFKFKKYLINDFIAKIIIQIQINKLFIKS